MRFWPSLVRAAKAGADFPMTEGQQIRDFMPVGDAAQAIMRLILGLKSMPANVAIQNIGTGNAMTLLEFAREQWAALKPIGSLLPGRIPYRPNEAMRYVPLV